MKEWKVKTNVMMQMNEHKIIRLKMDEWKSKASTVPSKWMNEYQKVQAS